MRIRIRLSKKQLAILHGRLREAYHLGCPRLIKRIHALLYILDGMSVSDVADLLALSKSTIYNIINAFLLNGVNSLSYKRPSGRPAKLTKKQRKELGELIKAGPEEAGYDCGCWDTSVIQDLILLSFGVEYNARYIAQLLDDMGFSYQKARFVSHHIKDVAKEQEEWMQVSWPKLFKLAKKKKAMILFGDEVSFAQWGTLFYTWAPKGEQATVKTSGKRKSYKVFGLIDYFSGRFFYKAHTGRFNSVSYEAFLQDVLDQTTGHLIIVQDGAKYHTSKAMKKFLTPNSERITVEQLPRYSHQYNPIEFLWRKVKKVATHLRYFPTFDDLVQKVEQKLKEFCNLPDEIICLMGRYCKSLGQETA